MGVEWIESDMRDFWRPEAFDLATCLFTPFGFFQHDADNRQVLANFEASREPGGTFGLDVAGNEVIASKFTSTTSRDLPDGLVVHRHNIIDDWNQIQNEWILLGDGAQCRFHSSHWLYSASELNDMLFRAGLRRCRFTAISPARHTMPLQRDLPSWVELQARQASPGTEHRLS